LSLLRKRNHSVTFLAQPTSFEFIEKYQDLAKEKLVPVVLVVVVVVVVVVVFILPYKLHLMVFSCCTYRSVRYSSNEAQNAGRNTFVSSRELLIIFCPILITV
jgi:hypothetical protein